MVLGLSTAMKRGTTTIIFAILVGAGCGGVNLAQLPSLSPLGVNEFGEIEVARHASARLVSFLVLGDAGTGGPDQVKVASAMLRWCDSQADGCDFATVLGDNIYNNGVNSSDDAKFKSHFESPYAEFGRFDMWMTAGNHDWHTATSVQDQIRYTLTSPRWRMPANHFAIPHLPPWLHIYALDTTVLRELGRDPADVEWSAAASSMIAAARNALCGQSGWRILFGHHPIYSSGEHGLEEDRESGTATSILTALEALINECDVQLYLAGHDHHQELIEVGNLVQVVQGAGGGQLRSTSVTDLALKGERWASERFGFAGLAATEAEISISYFGVVDGTGDPEPLCAWTLAATGRVRPSEPRCALR